LDHDNCLEITILRGPIKRVRDFANSLIASRGVRHGNIHMIPVTMSEQSHSDDGSAHVHSRPAT
jgi:CopG family nickel-responsive transcriptional regulator